MLNTNLMLYALLGTTSLYVLIVVPYEIWWSKSRSNPLTRKPKRTFELLLTMAYIIALIAITTIALLL